MKRYIFYLLVALLTFGISSFIALKLYWKSQEALRTSASSAFFNKLSKKPDFKSTFPKPFDSSQQEEKPTKPFCHDKNILPIWKVLLKDKDFREWSPFSDERKNCKEILNIKKVDLNQDGKKEIIILGRSLSLCSPVGNCAFWIFEKRGKNFSKLLYSTDYNDASKLGEQILKIRTKSYSDILLKDHWSAYETGYEFYKFNGREYKSVKKMIYTCTVFNDKSKCKLINSNEYKKLNR